MQTRKKIHRKHSSHFKLTEYSNFEKNSQKLLPPPSLPPPALSPPPNPPSPRPGASPPGQPLPLTRS